VKLGRNRESIGVDLDPEPLDWGRQRNLSQLEEGQRQRVTLLEEDVRQVDGRKADIIAAENFSWWIFKTRDDLLGYFRAAHANLADRGIFVLDLMGGHDVLIEEQEDVHKYKGFKYIWEEARFDPVSHHCLFHIHFRFKDGSELKKAFTYDWRLWSIPEARELLREAGFAETRVYWEGTDAKTGEGNDEWDPIDEAPADAVWIAYVVGVKK
jgi:cyclopropane fatty-acyl-phospholipid synthase-like methyltransferase